MWKSWFRTLFLLAVIGLTTLSQAAPAIAARWHQFTPPAPTDLEQGDEHGEIAPGELVGSPQLRFRFRVQGPAGDLLTPQVELRRVGEPFREANLTGPATIASGVPQWVEVTTAEALALSGYHWRARAVGSGGPGPWEAFGDNEDAIALPHRFADADFWNLHGALAAYARPAVGFDSLVLAAALPLMAPGVETRQVSSFDRTEGNNDGGSHEPGLESYFYREGNAEVVLEVDGPGQINRIWFAESNDPAFAGTRLQFLFDGDASVSYEIPVSDLVSGTVPPFVTPLVWNADHSSGGLVSLAPIPFRQGVKVRLVGPHAHYQITYQVFADGEGIQTFTGQEDYTLAQHLWQRVGQDPKPTRGNVLVQAGGPMAPGNSLLLAELNGPGVLQSLRLQIPQLEPTIVGTPPLSDGVRAHRDGEADFHLQAIDPTLPTRVRIRRGCRFAPQSAQVYVNNIAAGAWVRAEGNDRYRWCEDSFSIPTHIPLAETAIALRIASNHPDNAWEEARYWLEQHIDGDWLVVDALDVGDPASEQAHGYSIDGQTAQGPRTYTYPPLVSHAPASEALLAGLRLRITADGHDRPDVDVPVGAFFGSAVGLTNLDTLLAGMDPATHTLYSFWPVPFGQSLRVELVNDSPVPIPALDATIAHAGVDYPTPGRATGYFTVAESLSRPTSLDEDHRLIDRTGAGRLVGLHLLVHTGNEWLIEGDERWHVDGSLTPQVRGTGSEDVFNGGWYYNRGRVILPTHGVNSTRLEGWIDQFRWFVGDSIPFADSLRGGIEHGGQNDVNADYSSWTAAYLAEQGALSLVDVLDLADPTSMAAHQVAVAGPAVPFALVAQFEGDDDAQIAGGGLQLGAGAILTATLAVDPRARQVVLRRRFDQAAGNERLRVWVDGVPAGEWLDGGRNVARRWRESTFLLPPALTTGRHALVIRLQPVTWAGSEGATLARLEALSQYRRPYILWLPLAAR